MLMKHKVCVVTGAAAQGSIGQSTAGLLAAHGARVVIVDISDRVDDAARELRSAHPDSSAVGIRCDITSRGSCQDAAAEVLRVFSRVDALVHCAGVIRSGRYDEIGEECFEEVIDVNLIGAFNIMSAFASAMASQGSGTIVAVASVAAQRGGGLVGGAHYAASKGGVLSLTKSLARELGPVGVRVNAVCPSLIETNSVITTVGADRIRSITAAVPLGRPGKPEDVAGACLFLSSELSAYVTGATVDVNGGSHIH
jgi:NAD(P)-dependent dehydrogenase (short-subunit alcohol dehydrogenase family)